MEEVIDVPSHFLCPISLQIMKDPITISTGITYDRESIERWIFCCGNITCPVTNQLLSTPDLIPNHTLHRLIQSWCTLHHRNGTTQSRDNHSVDKFQLSNLLKAAKTFPESKLECLEKLKSIVLEQQKWQMRLVEDVGGVDFLASIIQSECVSRSSDEALYILCQLELSAKVVKDLGRENVEFVDSLQQIMNRGSSQSRVYATKMMDLIFEVADPIELFNVRSDLFIELVHILEDFVSYQSIKSALKLLSKLCPWGRNRITAVEANAVMALIELLLNTSDRRVCELAMTVLDRLCSCAEGREEFLKHGGGLAIVSKKILRVSPLASDRGVRVLSSISKFSATPWVLQEMVQVGVVSKLLCVLDQCEGSSSKTRERCRAMLKMHSRVWRSSPCLPDHLLSFYPSSD